MLRGGDRHEAYRRRARAITERCLPTMIREADYEQLEELIAVFHWFGNSEAMGIEAPEEHVQGARGFCGRGDCAVRFRISAARPAQPAAPLAREAGNPTAGGGRRRSVAPAPPLVELVGTASAATAVGGRGPSASALVEPAVRQSSNSAARPLPDRAFAVSGSRIRRLHGTGCAATRRCRIAGAPDALSRFQERPMWLLDPKTKKIVGERRREKSAAGKVRDQRGSPFRSARFQTRALYCTRR